MSFLAPGILGVAPQRCELIENYIRLSSAAGSSHEVIAEDVSPMVPSKEVTADQVRQILNLPR